MNHNQIILSVGAYPELLYLRACAKERRIHRHYHIDREPSYCRNTEGYLLSVADVPQLCRRCTAETLQRIPPLLS
jgi:hypothetical protein